ncbi:MAG: hypothetical protein EPO32_09875 [Anaerolineae bacterium]|nr:MAG: hypothetical protein EPO32_09875 [Anaerolineae bacterium]
MPGRMPDFLLIGAIKSATTSLFLTLEQHPRVFRSPVKEANFFNLVGTAAPPERGRGESPVRFISSLDDYTAIFAPAGESQLVGEGTPTYLQNPYAAQQIANYVPQARLIAILRNPIDRAYSHYLMDAGQLKESRGFEEVIHAELAGFGGQPAPEGPPPLQTGYLYTGLYWHHLQTYHRLLPAAQLKTILFEDFAHHRDETLKDLCVHLGIDPHFAFGPSQRIMESYSVRQAGVMGLLKRVRAGRLLRRIFPQRVARKIRSAGLSQLTEKPKPMPNAARAALLEFYRPEIVRLQNLLGRDLGGWLAEPPPA